MRPASQSYSRNNVYQALADLKHLDLTGSVEYESPRRPVARGGFGEVYKGRYKKAGDTELKVALKCLTVYLDGSRDAMKIFKREIKAWSGLRHPNVLPFLGYTLEESGSHVSPSLISEWMDNGNVLEFVIQNPNCNIAKLILGMSRGLAYLHEKNIVHSDFKSANVLVSTAQEAVICDFGSSHISHNVFSTAKSSEATGLRGTTRWWAYELLIGSEEDPKASKASDTWAFGMTVYELLTNGPPYAHLYYEVQVMMSILNRELPSLPTGIREGYKKQIWDVCASCWAWDPDDRPTMAEISTIVGNIVESTLTVAMPLPSEPPQENRDGDPRSIINELRSEFPHLELAEVNLDESIHLKMGYISDRFIVDHVGSKVTLRRVQYFWMGDPKWKVVVMECLRSLTSMSAHLNVEELVGYVWKEEVSLAPMPVFRFVGNEDILTYFKHNPQCNIVNMILGVAQGLAYLHDHDFVHAGIRAPVIIINERGHPVITELYSWNNLLRFGSGMSYARWTAIECFPLIGSNALAEPSREHAKERDIWAFGMTIYELLSGNKPYVYYKLDIQVASAITKGELPRCPASYEAWPFSQKTLWEICQKCWNKEPSTRPSMDKLVTALEGLLAMQNVVDM